MRHSPRRKPVTLWYGAYVYLKGLNNEKDTGSDHGITKWIYPESRGGFFSAALPKTAIANLVFTDAKPHVIWERISCTTGLVNKSTKGRIVEGLPNINSFMIYNGSCFTYFPYNVENEDQSWIPCKCSGVRRIHYLVFPFFWGAFENLCATGVFFSHCLNEHNAASSKYSQWRPLFSIKLYCLDLRRPKMFHVLFRGKDTSSYLRLGHITAGLMADTTWQKPQIFLINPRFQLVDRCTKAEIMNVHLSNLFLKLNTPSEKRLVKLFRAPNSIEVQN